MDDQNDQIELRTAIFKKRPIMNITITANEAINKGIWEGLCAIKKWNPWIVNEGLMPSNEEILLSEREAMDLGLITRTELPWPCIIKSLKTGKTYLRIVNDTMREWVMFAEEEPTIFTSREKAIEMATHLCLEARSYHIVPDSHVPKSNPEVEV